MIYLIATPSLQHLGVGAVVFLVGAAIYVINLLMGLARRGRSIPFDGVGLMLLGLGLAVLLNW